MPLVLHLASVALAQGFDWPQTELANGLWDAQHVAIGDLDGDGAPDLLLSGDTLGWYPSLGGPPVTLAPLAASEIRLGDLDGDGDADVVKRYDGWSRNDGGVFAAPALVDGWIPADVDGDGDPDLLDGIGGVAFVENLGSGLFGARVEVADPLSTLLAVLDVDGDGDEDLVSAVNHRLEVLVNDGTGTFTQAGPTPVFSDRATQVAPADLDGDGDVDLAVAVGDGTVAWVENAGGALGAATVLGSASWPPPLLVVADVDGDGDPDLVAVPGDAQVYPNLGGGLFGPAEDLGASSAVADVAAADLDGDGDVDLAVARNADSYLFSYRSAWLENPGYPDADQDGLSDAAEAARGTDPLADDTDGDGLSDRDELLTWRTDPTDPLDGGTVDRDGDRVSDADEAAAGTDPLRGDTDGDGAFDALEGSLGSDPLDPDSDGDGFDDGAEHRCGSSPTDAASFDTDCDGLDDADEALAGTDPVDPDSDDDGLLDGPELAPWGSDPLDPDSDAGGTDDGVEADRGGSPTDPSDDWAARPVFAVGQGLSVAAEDLDGDGDVDLAVAVEITVNQPQAAWLESTLGGASFVQHDLAALGTCESIAAADVDGDGLPDLLLAGYAATAFAPGPAFVAATTISSHARDLPGSVAADLDGDGDQDAVVPRNDYVELVEALGGGAFAAPVLALDVDHGSALAAEDLDGDGDLDLLIGVTNGYAEVLVAENLGGLAFAAPVRLAWDLDLVRDLAAVDLDGDGDRDVVAATEVGGWALGPGGALTFENLGGLAFAAAETVDAAADTLTAADLDGDGDPDLVLGRSAEAWIGWVENDGSGAFGAPRAIATGRDALAELATGDLDADGDLDVAAVTGAADPVEWFENALSPCFADDDGDGFGADPSPCVAGTAPVDGDCDDADAAIHPGAPEVVGDGTDQDCDGLDDIAPADTADTAAPVPPRVETGETGDTGGPPDTGDAPIDEGCGGCATGGGGAGWLALAALGLARRTSRPRVAATGP